MGDERTVEPMPADPMMVPTGLAQFATTEGQRRMIALADEFVAVCKNRREREMPWSTQIGSGEHLHIEAWQYLGQRAGITARTAETRELRNPVTGEFEGSLAVTEAILVSTGQVIGRAEQVCMADELHPGTIKFRWRNTNGAPLRHAILGMAQTRSQSRVLASVLRFIAELAGMRGTPAEEMDGVQPEGQPAKPPIKPPQRKSANGGAASQVVEGIVDDLQERPYKKPDGTTGKRWGVGIGGQLYGTFDPAVFDTAKRALDFAEQVRLTWAQSGEYRNVVSLEIVAAPTTAKSTTKPAEKPAPREPGEDPDEFSDEAGRPKKA